jgi:cystathionine beta-lyase family protein involved in aluminum resistance
VIDQVLAGRKFDPRVIAAAKIAAAQLAARTDPTRTAIRLRVLDAFYAEGVDESDLAGTTGYGYDDPARARYESLLARYFRAEAVLARLSIVSGTHAIVATLAACVRPGEAILCANGAPYDTLRNAIVTAKHSLVSDGRTYDEVALKSDGNVDIAALKTRVRDAQPRAVFVQRSRGYSTRRSLSINTIGAICSAVKASSPNTLVLVDNCYGELVEEREPLEVGADAIMGSLIKNIGGGLAPTGGYIAGRAEIIERVATRIFAPGLGAGLGPTLGFGRALIQGFFYAPGVVENALRGLDFTAALFAALGYDVSPAPGSIRTDIVQAIRLGDRSKLIAFARGLQRAMPINARFAPEPGPVPGYVDPVIMSSGSFVSGATIDLSCDAPLRPPFEMYLQGGAMLEQAVLGGLLAADAVVREGAHAREEGRD